MSTSLTIYFKGVNLFLEKSLYKYIKHNMKMKVCRFAYFNVKSRTVFGKRETWVRSVSAVP